jgi:hypothetical protein
MRAQAHLLLPRFGEAPQKLEQIPVAIWSKSEHGGGGKGNLL